MKRITFITILMAVFAVAAVGQITLPRESQRQEITQTIGDTSIRLVYHRPNVKGRKIWDGLVPYNKVWRAGANEATLFEFSQDVTINGKPLPAGKYSFHVIPAAAEWTLIFNKDEGQWGSFNYNEKDDAIRVTAGVQKSDFREALTYSFVDPKPDGVDVTLAWENVAVSFNIGIGDLHGRMLSQFRNTIKERKEDDVRALNQGAGYVVTFRVADNYNEAMEWVNASIAVHETYGNLATKARLLKLQGKTAEAITTAEKALAVGRAAEPPVNPNAAAVLEGELAAWKAGN